MHPFPATEELSFFVGAEMAQITIDPYGVRFTLTHGRSLMGIVSGGRFAYRSGGIEDVFEPSEGCNSQQPVRFHALLNQAVSTLTRSPEGDALTFVFTSGQILTICAELGGFESGSISWDGAGGGLWIF